MTTQSDYHADQTQRREAVRRMSIDGMALIEIAMVLGVTRRTVCRHRRALRLSKPQPKQLTKDEIEQARIMVKDGCPLFEVAATLHRSRTSIEKYCKGMSPLKSDPLRTHRQMMINLGLL